MKEIDILISVLEEDGYMFADEKSKFGSDTNILEYYKGLLNASVYFNFKTGQVNSVYVNMDRAFVKSEVKNLEIKYQSKLRDHKIGSILNHSK